MADIFGKLGDSLKNTIKEAVDQTQKSVDQVGPRAEILTKKNEIKKLYQTLGEAQYKNYMGAEEVIDLQSIYDKITMITDDIKKAEEKIEDLVTKQKTSFSSYKENVKTAWDDITTPEPKAEAEEVDSAEDVQLMKVCEVCHTGNNLHAAYCIHCGNKFE